MCAKELARALRAAAPTVAAADVEANRERNDVGAEETVRVLRAAAAIVAAADAEANREPEDPSAKEIVAPSVLRLQSLLPPTLKPTLSTRT